MRPTIIITTGIDGLALAKKAQLAEKVKKLTDKEKVKQDEEADVKNEEKEDDSTLLT